MTQMFDYQSSCTIRAVSHEWPESHEQRLRRQDKTRWSRFTSLLKFLVDLTVVVRYGNLAGDPPSIEMNSAAARPKQVIPGNTTKLELYRPLSNRDQGRDQGICLLPLHVLDRRRDDLNAPSRP